MVSSLVFVFLFSLSGCSRSIFLRYDCIFPTMKTIHHENHICPSSESLSLPNLAIPWVSEQCWVSLREHISFLFSSSISWRITCVEKKFCLCLKFSFFSLEFYLFICLSSFLQHISQAMPSPPFSYVLSGP